MILKYKCRKCSQTNSFDTEKPDIILMEETNIRNLSPSELRALCKFCLTVNIIKKPAGDNHDE